MKTNSKTKKGALIQTPIEKKLLSDLFASAPKVLKALNDVIRGSYHFNAVEMDLMTRLTTLFSEVARRPVEKESEK